MNLYPKCVPIRTKKIPTKPINTGFVGIYLFSKADIRNSLSLLAHERSCFAACQWELLTPTDISIPFTYRLVLYALEAGECLFCVQTLGRRDLSSCFLVHICAFYSSYSSYFAFLCTSSKIFRAKMDPNIL